jgi:hypothetical protein
MDEPGAGKLDWSRCAIDPISVRAAKTGPNSVDRGKRGSMIYLLTDRAGLPLSVGISAANTHDMVALEPLVRGIAPIRSRRGPRRRLPAKCTATRATTTPTCGPGYADGASRRASRAATSSPPTGSGGTAG